MGRNNGSRRNASRSHAVGTKRKRSNSPAGDHERQTKRRRTEGGNSVPSATGEKDKFRRLEVLIQNLNETINKNVKDLNETINKNVNDQSETINKNAKDQSETINKNAKDLNETINKNAKDLNESVNKVNATLRKMSEGVYFLSGMFTATTLKPAAVFICSQRSSATGCLVILEGCRFLLTNAHVLYWHRDTVIYDENMKALFSVSWSALPPTAIGAGGVATPALPNSSPVGNLDLPNLPEGALLFNRMAKYGCFISHAETLLRDLEGCTSCYKSPFPLATPTNATERNRSPTAIVKKHLEEALLYTDTAMKRKRQHYRYRDGVDHKTGSATQMDTAKSLLRLRLSIRTLITATVFCQESHRDIKLQMRDIVLLKLPQKAASFLALAPAKFLEHDRAIDLHDVKGVALRPFQSAYLDHGQQVVLKHAGITGNVLGVDPMNQARCDMQGKRGFSGTGIATHLDGENFVAGVHVGTTVLPHNEDHEHLLDAWLDGGEEGDAAEDVARNPATRAAFLVRGHFDTVETRHINWKHQPPPQTAGGSRQ